MTGRFISFEGTEGSGKTSIIQAVVKYFQTKQIPVDVTREPGGPRISEKIRAIILDKTHTEMDALTEAFLFAASRRQHLVQTIIPLLDQGHLVLCDRFVDSSLIYQGIARNLGIDKVYHINQIAIEDHFPDLTFFIDVRPEVGLARVFANSNREVNRLDLEQLDFHQRIYQGYLDLINQYPNRIKRIDGERSIDAIAADIIEQIEGLRQQHE